MDLVQEQAKKLDSKHKQKEKELIARFEQFDIEGELTKFEFLKDENFEEINNLILSQENEIKLEKKEQVKLEKNLQNVKDNFIELSKLNDKFLNLENYKLNYEALHKKEDYFSDLKELVEKLTELQKSKDKIREYRGLINKHLQLKKLEMILLDEEKKYKIDLENNIELESKLTELKDDIEIYRQITADQKFFYNNIDEFITAKKNISVYNKKLEELSYKKNFLQSLEANLKIKNDILLESNEEKNILDGSIGKLKLEILKKTQEVDKFKEFENSQSELREKKSKYEVAKKQLEEFHISREELEKGFLLLKSNREKEILNSFILNLHEGDDCPLCKQRIDHLPDMTSIVQVDENIEKSLQDVTTKIIKLETLLQKDEQEINNLSKIIKEQEEIVNFKALEELIQLEEELKQETVNLKRVVDEIKLVEKEIKKLKKDIEESSILLNEEEQLKQSHLEAKNKINQFENNVEVKLDEFKGYYENIASQVDEYDNVYKSFQNNSNDLLIRKTKIETEQKNNIKNIEEVTNEIELLKNSFTNSKLSKYYCSLEEAEENAIELDKLEQYQVQIDEFEDSKKILLNSIEKLEQELTGINQPDLEQEREKLQSFENEVSNFIEKMAVLTTRLDNNKKLYKRIHDDYLELLNSSKDIREIIEFSDVVSGKTESRKSLETYVQGYYLDLILVAGTKRLLQMTNDRYRFIRRDEKSKGGGLQGLEIEIHDIYLNSTRIISSLSGGELFLASLALALGLAEVIQNESGGISLETIFIDEGFGSLDAETLDTALTTLIDLQSYGRNIGIISHVSELKERIRPKIEVYAQENYAKVKMTGI